MRHHFASVTKVRAPQGVVWDIVTDHRRYAEWSSAREVILDPPGSPDPNGPGAVRVFVAGPLRVREEVVAWEPPAHLGYRVVGGLPVRDHRADIHLEEDGPVTVMTWASSFRSAIPLGGRPLRWVMRRAVDRFADGIRRAAEGTGRPASGEREVR